MSGIKNHIQQIGAPITNNYNHIKDPIERDFAFQSMRATPYCKSCGREILMPSKEESRDYDMELKMQMHEQCLREHEQKIMQEKRIEAKRQAALKAKEPKEPEVSWEEKMKEHMERRAKELGDSR